MLLSNLMNKILHGSQRTSTPYFLRFRYVAPSATPSFVHQEYEINLGVGVLALGFPLAFAISKHGGLRDQKPSSGGIGLCMARQIEGLPAIKAVEAR